MIDDAETIIRAGQAVREAAGEVQRCTNIYKDAEYAESIARQTATAARNELNNAIKRLKSEQAALTTAAGDDR